MLFMFLNALSAFQVVENVRRYLLFLSLIPVHLKPFVLSQKEVVEHYNFGTQDLSFGPFMFND